MKITIADEPLKFYVDLMKEGKLFSMARYFDGEWNSITGRRGYPLRTGGGHTYFPALKNDLCESILKPHIHPLYFYGTWYAIQQSGNFSNVFCTHNDININWHNGYIYHDASMKGNLFPLIEQLRNKKIIMIGPDSLRSAEDRLFKYEHYIRTEDRDCYLQQDSLVDQTLDVAFDGCLIAVHASLAGKSIVYKLYSHLKDSCYIIDFGSIWNVFCPDAKPRGWWRKKLESDPRSYNNIISRNLGETVEEAS